MHIDDEHIQRILHGEVGAAAQEGLDRHLAECAPCRQKLAEAERDEEWIFGILRATDDAAPAVDPQVLMAAAKDHAVAMPPRRLPSVTLPGARVGWLQLAAGLALAIMIAGAAYTAPGSPFPALVEGVAAWLRKPALEAPPPMTPETAESERSSSVTAGIAVAPGERFIIQFSAFQERGIVKVSLTDSPTLTARALHAAATFTTGADRLTIVNRGSTADYEIELPAGAPRIEILAGSRRLFLKEGSQLVTGAPADARGRYLLSLSASGPDTSGS